ncbi:MAG: hypothetical protein RML36_15295 [Anaerolineae bacterium]|nr:hypothetical protein [Anaerolineae bacterium]
MDTAVFRGLLKEAYEYLWSLLEQSDDFNERVPETNRLRFLAEETGRIELKGDPSKPYVLLMPSGAILNYTLSNTHIELVLNVTVYCTITGKDVDKLLDLYEVILGAVDKWRVDQARPAFIQRIQGGKSDAQLNQKQIVGWSYVTNFEMRLVLTR